MVMGLVRDELIDKPRAFNLLAGKPAELLGVSAGVIEAGREADIAVIDPAAPWVVDRRKMEATADNTPFDMQGVEGRVRALIKGGVSIAL